MRRPWQVWIAFSACLAVVLTAMAWVSLTALRLDRAEASARRRAALEENVRLALWRIDSALTPLVARESARPYFAYRTMLPVDRAYGRMFDRRGASERLVPSPLLAETSPHVLVHFQFEPDGRLTSPQVPADDNYGLAVPRCIAEESVARARAQLARLQAVVDRPRLMAMLPEPTSEPIEVVFAPLVQTPQQPLAQRQQQAEPQQQAIGAVDYQQRSQAVRQSANVVLYNQQMLNPPGEPPLVASDSGGVLMKPLWIGGDLVLARRVAADGRQYVQGCLLDWPAIRTSLLAIIEDLLPRADLQAVATTPLEGESRMLAALPVRLLPSRQATGADGVFSPIRLSLVLAWACVLLAALAVAALVFGVLRLSERRATFVSAVTHELRTPLTTFQIYTEMLAEGMVPDADRRLHYLGTLRREAARLTHLVENVLSYARLERGRPNGQSENLPLGQLLDRIDGRLADRASQAGMRLVVEPDERAFSAQVRADPSAVEQILFNLVDNACKYAREAADKRIHLAAGQTAGRARLRVSDHGPGISPRNSRRLFRSFSKSASEAAGSAPGVGLGLALSRRLARDMGGDLRLDNSVAGGACFVLTLPTPKRPTKP